MLTDSELLRRYVQDGAEDAFAELVQRYAGLVFSTALRVAAGDTHLAEDITQEAFIRLIQKAPQLVRHEALAGWLHTTTRHVGLRLLRSRRRREFREQEAVAMQTNSAPEVAWEKLRPLLDAAVGQLNARDRQAVLLRYFQGWSHQEVGAALGLDADAARMRTERAVEKLRHNFARSGVATSAILLAEVLAANSATAAPAALVGKVQATSLARAKELGLGYLVLKTFFMTSKTKLMAIVAVIVAMLVIFSNWFFALPSAVMPKIAQITMADKSTAAPQITQVAKPVIPPSLPREPAALPGTAGLNKAQQQALAELNIVLANMARDMRAGQSLFDYRTPEELASLGYTTPESIRQERAGEHEILTRLDDADLRSARNMIEVHAQSFEILANQIPVINASGDEATYDYVEVTSEDFDSGIYSLTGEHLPATFIKIKGKWYIKPDVKPPTARPETNAGSGIEQPAQKASSDTDAF